MGYEYGTADVVLLLPVTFPAMTEAGTYTLSVPEGVIVEGEWNDAWMLVPVEGGVVNAATTATFTIDPSAKGVLDNYSLMPEAGSSVTTLNGVQIAFPDVESYADMWQSEYEVPLIASNGEISYEGFATQDWNNEAEYKVMNISFTDEETWEYVTFTSGTWTLTIPSGAFVLDGDVNPEIVAEYNILAPAEEPFATYMTFPEADSDVKQLNGLKLMYIWNDPEASVNVNEELLGQINIVKEDGNYVWTDFEVGEPSLIMNDMMLMLPLLFDAQTEAGKYELQIPRGLFYQTKYNEETGEFGIFPGYEESAAQSFVFNVDPELPGLLEDVTLSPESGMVNSLDNVVLTFNSIPSYMSLNMLGFDDITLTDGATTYTGVATLTDPYLGNQFSISFVDDKDDEVAVGAGNWTLTIPSGYFMFEGTQSAEMIVNYNVTPMVLTPAPGSTLNEITYFEIAFPGTNKVEFVGEPYMITLMLGQSSGIPAFNVVAVEGAAVPTFRMTPIDEFEEPRLGALTLGIEEGAFLIDGKNGQTEGNSPRLQATYYYDRPISQDYLPEPNAEEVLCQSWGYTVGFVFDNVAFPFIVDLQTFEGIEVKFDDTVLRIGSEYACNAGLADCAWSVMDNILSFFVVNPDFHKEGVISVSMTGDAYTLSGNPGFDVEHSWRVVMPQAYEFTLNPDGGETEADAAVVDSLEEITLVFENAQTAEVFRQSGVSLRTLDYSLYITAEIVPIDGAEHPTFKLVFTPGAGEEFTEGIYKLQIGYDTFTLDGVQGWPSDYTDVERMYKLDDLSGIGDVGASESNIVTVVTTDGRIVIKNASADSLNTLDNGIYIVNGKKVVIGK